MRVVIALLIVILFILAWYLIRIGLEIRQGIFRIDPNRNSSVMDMLERKIHHGILNVKKHPGVQMGMYAFLFTVSMLMPSNSAILVESQEGYVTSDTLAGEKVSSSSANVRSELYIDTSDNSDSVSDSETVASEESSKEVSKAESNSEVASKNNLDDDITPISEIKPTDDKVLALGEVPVVEEEEEVTEESKDDSDISAQSESESAWTEIPLCDTVSAVKTYMDAKKITSKSSEQYKLFNQDKYGVVECDDLGFYYIDDVDPDTGEPMRFYTVALGTYYADHIGQKFRVTMENGFVFGAVLGDFKSDEHTNAGSETESLNEEDSDRNTDKCLAGSKDMIEFIINSSKVYKNFPGNNGLANNGSMNAKFDDEHNFKGLIAKIEVLEEEN